MWREGSGVPLHSGIVSSVEDGDPKSSWIRKSKEAKAAAAFTMRAPYSLSRDIRQGNIGAGASGAGGLASLMGEKRS